MTISIGGRVSFLKKMGKAGYATYQFVQQLDQKERSVT
jgi:hypothetical protein